MLTTYGFFVFLVLGSHVFLVLGSHVSSSFILRKKLSRCYICLGPSLILRKKHSRCHVCLGPSSVLCEECHGHAHPRRVVHGRMPMTSSTLYVFSYSSVLLLYFYEV